MSKQEVIICHNLEENLNKAITNAHMTNYLSWLMNIRVNFAFLFYLDLIVLKMPILFI